MSETLTATAPVIAVTVLEDRASVTRKGHVHVPAGQHRVIIDRVSPVVVDKTLLATATGGRVIDIRCERYTAPWRAVETVPVIPEAGAIPADEAAAAMWAERARLEQAIGLASAAALTARAAQASTDDVLAAAVGLLASTAGRGVTVLDAAPRLAELDVLSAAARKRVVETEHALAIATAELERATLRSKLARDQAGEEAARLVIDVAAEQPGEVVLTISYVVPGAAWRPYHRAVLDRDAGRVQWQTTACVWQATGEDWLDSALTFSLERPSLGVEPPSLVDDQLVARKKPETVTVEAREHIHQTTGLGSGGPAQVPGIDDGGLGLRLSGTKPATVRASGLPHRIAVGEFSAAAQLALVAIPLRTPWVHTRARLANTGTAPLLAGPVDLIMASGYVGVAEIGFVAPGETFELGFGPDADVRVHRVEERTREEAGILGGWNVQTVRVDVRVSNLGTKRREVAITERVPISEVEQVEVVVSGPEAYLLGADAQAGGEAIPQITARAIDERGLVTWTIELPPLGRRAVALEYRVKSQRGVTGV